MGLRKGGVRDQGVGKAGKSHFRRDSDTALCTYVTLHDHHGTSCRPGDIGLIILDLHQGKPRLREVH